VYYDEFERIVNRPDGFANAGTKKEVVTRACHAFDEAGHGTIGVVELRYVLKRLGEMSDAEVDELLKRVPPGTNSAVNIDSIIAAIFGQ
jgi:Ca2+-binding EF-hand superfamily protein